MIDEVELLNLKRYNSNLSEVVVNNQLVGNIYRVIERFILIESILEIRVEGVGTRDALLS